jgi:hypothetical protein
MTARQAPWLLLVSSVSGDNKTARMRIWRALKASGAGSLRDGVYVLPNSAEARKVFQKQAEDVVATGGSASLLALEADGEAQQRDFAALFDRSTEYAAVLKELASARRALTRMEEAEARRTLMVLGRDVATLSAIDFFPGPSREQVEHALADLEVAFNAKFSPDEPHAARGGIAKRARAEYRGRIWATRQRPWVDRVASAWLIRRFIDPRAKFIWLEKPSDCPKTALGFDFDGAEFSHVGARVTFEVLVAAFGLEHDAALARVAHLVHYLDIGGVPVPEAAGFAAILAGTRSHQANDDKLMQSISPVLDALYASFQITEGEGK